MPLLSISSRPVEGGILHTLCKGRRVVASEVRPTGAPVPLLDLASRAGLTDEQVSALNQHGSVQVPPLKGGRKRGTPQVLTGYRCAPDVRARLESWRHAHGMTGAEMLAFVADTLKNVDDTKKDSRIA